MADRYGRGRLLLAFRHRHGFACINKPPRGVGFFCGTTLLEAPGIAKNNTASFVATRIAFYYATSLVAASIAHLDATSGASVLQRKLCPLAALMLLSVVLRNGLLDHGLVLSHVSLAALFHHGSSHLRSSHFLLHHLRHHHLLTHIHR